MIQIIAVGRLKEPYLKEAQQSLIKQIEKKIKIEVWEVQDEKTSEYCSIKEVEKIRNLEAERLISKMDPSSYVVVTDINAKSVSDKDMKDLIRNYGQDSKKLTFLIGGSLGLSQKMKNSCDRIVSFSNLTFPHQLFRIMLLEQINSVIER